MSAPQAQTPAIRDAERRLRTLLPGIYRDRTDEVRPTSMGSAPLAFDAAGKVTWDRIWGSFCDLALAGGPPHKGQLLLPATPHAILADPARYAENTAEILRGITLAARLPAELSFSPGWVRVRCSSPTMAGWLLRAITMENVAVRQEESSILLPAGPAFCLEKEIKNVITAISKTTHYWTNHLQRPQQIAISNLFDELEADTPLLQPTYSDGPGLVAARERLAHALTAATGLRATSHTYADWLGLDCSAVTIAITTMRRLVATNILCRREDTALFLPVNPAADPDGTRTTETVAALLA